MPELKSQTCEERQQAKKALQGRDELTLTTAAVDADPDEVKTQKIVPSGAH